MTMHSVQPVILCGGSGTRLWPLSRSGFPKQFLCLTGGDSPFQQAAKRLNGMGAKDIAVHPSIIVSGEEHRFLVLEQLREIGIELGAALLEPVGRNTAPALTLSALAALENGDDPILVVIPADQTVADLSAFTAAIQTSIREAASGSIVILGIRPDRPETGYGYIKVSTTIPPTPKSGWPSVMPTFLAERFVEKPDILNARLYLDDSRYYWNAGMFVLKASVWMAALEYFRLDIAEAVREAWSARHTDDNPATRFIRPGKTQFSAVPAESIDYAVIERCPGSVFTIRMIALDAGWSDLGSWDAIWQILPKDTAGNSRVGDVLMTGCRNTLAQATSRLVSLVGVENLVVIETPDAVLVADRACSQEVSTIATDLQFGGRAEHISHRKVHRPWGWYDCIDEGFRFKVKRIQVNPKASLSLQKHNHRAEHWIVVKGTAEITNGEKTIILTENQSTFIPLGATHRLANPGTIPLEIIEVQSGSYLGEDDIVRFEDNYGR
jgi:mannose-1-phosphate guanylyltransferase/mannose-6-phosphate isomerase